MHSGPQMTPRNWCWGSQSRSHSFSKKRKTPRDGVLLMPGARSHL